MDLSTAQRGPRKFGRDSRLRWGRRRLKELVVHLNRTPSITEEILIRRIISLEWMLMKMDERIDEEGLGELSGHAQRAYLAAENRLRLDLQALGLKPPAPPEPDWHDFIYQREATDSGATDEATGRDVDLEAVR